MGYRQVEPVQVVYEGNVVTLGCPLGGCIRSCAGGWPGTIMTGAKIVEAAKKGRLIPGRLGCPTTQRYAEIANALFAPKAS